MARIFAPNSKILYSMLAVMLATALLPLALISWRLITINRDTLVSKQYARQLQAAQNRARELELFVNSYADRTAGYARALEFVGAEGINELNQTRLGELLGQDPHLLAIAVAPVSGDMVVSSHAGWLSEPDLRAIVSEATVGAGEKYFMAPRRIGAAARPAAIIAEPVRTGGRLAGTVVSVVDLGSVLGFVAAGKPDPNDVLSGENTTSFVVDAQGAVIASADPRAVDEQRSMRGNSLVDDWLAGAPNVRDMTGQYTETDANGQVQLIGAIAEASMPAGGRFGVVSAVTQEGVFGSVARMRNLTLWASIVAGFITLLVAVLFAGQIANPIRELARGTRAIANGDFSHRIKLVSLNETGQLADDFNLMAEKLEDYVEKLREAAETNRALFIGTVRALAAAIDGKDPYTRGHSERVAAYSEAIAIELGLNDEEVEKIRIGGLMHDIGKIAIEDKILRKPAPLTEDEFEIMREHPERGTKIMAEIPQMREYISGMRFHHEMLNGKGYPLGLQGDQIPLMARIVSVADTFDAMTTNRPYQKHMPLDQVFERIRAMVNSRYDPEVVAALIAAYEHGRIKLRMQPRPAATPAEAKTATVDAGIQQPAEPAGSSR